MPLVAPVMSTLSGFAGFIEWLIEFVRCA